MRFVVPVWYALIREGDHTTRAHLCSMGSSAFVVAVVAIVISVPVVAVEVMGVAGAVGIEGIPMVTTC